MTLCSPHKLNGSIAFHQGPCPATDLVVGFAGRYEILSVLAKGGQALVYVAVDRQKGRRVALKVVDNAFCSSRDPHDRLMREAEIGSGLDCENIVEVFDSGWDERTGCSYISMELLSGRDFQRLVASEGPLTPALAVECLKQVAAGLDCAHHFRNQRGFSPVVHRDLKPENLFLCDSAGGKHVVKVLDFGVAKILERHATDSADIRGTPIYMAPEQLIGATVTPATDVWAFALVTFFLLTGRSYWMEGQPNNGSLKRLFAEILTAPLVAPSIRIRQLGSSCELDAGFDAWFLTCVHRNPKRRFTSTGHAVRALARVLRVPLDSTLSSAPHRSLLHYRLQCVHSGRMMNGVPQWFWVTIGVIAGFVSIVTCGIMTM